MLTESRSLNQSPGQGFVCANGLCFALDTDLHDARHIPVLHRLPRDALKHKLHPVIAPAGGFAFLDRGKHVGSSRTRDATETGAGPFVGSLGAVMHDHEPFPCCFSICSRMVRISTLCAITISSRRLTVRRKSSCSFCACIAASITVPKAALAAPI